jgi:hypothetical protein
MKQKLATSSQVTQGIGNLGIDETKPHKTETGRVKHNEETR